MEVIVDTFAFLNTVKITAKIGVDLYIAPWHEDENIYFHFSSANKFVPLWHLAGNVLCKFCLVAAWRFDPSIMWRPPAGTAGLAHCVTQNLVTMGGAPPNTDTAAPSLSHGETLAKKHFEPLLYYYVWATLHYTLYSVHSVGKCVLLSCSRTFYHKISIKRLIGWLKYPLLWCWPSDGVTI